MGAITMVGIVGSPRKGKNTDVLVQKVLEGGRSEGPLTDKIYLDDLGVQPCQACRKQS